jgi:hypothetical protein
MKSTLTLLTLFLLSIVANASKVYQGYIILNDDARIEGNIEMLSPTLNEVKVKFISAEGGREQVYKAKEVKEYGFKVEKWNDEKRTHEAKLIVYARHKVQRSPIPFGPTEVLIEREVSGTINLFNHFIEANTNPNQPITHVIYIQKERGDLMDIHQDNYKTVLQEMTAEYPELSAKIGTKDHTFKYLNRIITDYNIWMLDNGEEMVLDF